MEFEGPETIHEMLLISIEGPETMYEMLLISKECSLSRLEAGGRV
jgi:hypothetical protein